ncbi:MAG: J domain-containing protein [Nitrospirota bacterium]
MGDSHKFSQNARNKQLIFAAAGFIKRFDENPPLDEIYNRAVESYEVLIDVIEKPEIANEVSDLIKQPPEKIRMSALKIMNVLLFNDKNNPFMSLGLAKSATEHEIKKRWKRLLMLYHPDKLNSQKRVDQAAKKINEVYEELRQRKEKNIDPQRIVKKPWQPLMKQQYFRKSDVGISNSKYFRYLPAIILIVFISLALFAIALFVIDRLENKNSEKSKHRAEQRISIHILK